MAGIGRFSARYANSEAAGLGSATMLGRVGLSALADLCRDDVDPGWPEVWATFPGHANDLTEVPPEWDPCVTSKPHRPEDPPKPRGERKGNDAN